MDIPNLTAFIISFIGAAAVSGVSFITLSTIQKKVLQFIEKKSSNSSSLRTIIVKQLLESTHVFFLIIFSVFFGSLCMAIEGNIPILIKKVTFISLIVLVGLWANVVINHAIALIGAHYQQKKGMSKAIFSMLRTLAKIAIWTILILFIMDNLQFQVSTLVASLGIGGIALALAVQNILQDLFASLSIIVDEPFIIGDLIAIDEYIGYVEYIGIKSTRIRSLSGELIVFSNGDLLKSRLRNYKKMEERRVKLVLDVVYETPLEKVKKIPAMLKKLIAGAEKVRFGRAHLKEFGSYALNFEVVYYVLSADYMTYMDVQHQVNEMILEKFQDEAIEFAYPTSKSIRIEPK